MVKGQVQRKKRFRTRNAFRSDEVCVSLGFTDVTHALARRVILMHSHESLYGARIDRRTTGNDKHAASHDNGDCAMDYNRQRISQLKDHLRNEREDRRDSFGGQFRGGRAVGERRVERRKSIDMKFTQRMENRGGEEDEASVRGRERRKSLDMKSQLKADVQDRLEEASNRGSFRSPFGAGRAVGERRSSMDAKFASRMERRGSHDNVNADVGTGRERRKSVELRNQLKTGRQHRQQDKIGDLYASPFGAGRAVGERRSSLDAKFASKTQDKETTSGAHRASNERRKSIDMKMQLRTERRDRSNPFVAGHPVGLRRKSMDLELKFDEEKKRRGSTPGMEDDSVRRKSFDMKSQLRTERQGHVGSYGFRPDARAERRASLDAKFADRIGRSGINDRSFTQALINPTFETEAAKYGSCRDAAAPRTPSKVSFVM